MREVIKINPRDNVCVALTELQSGTVITIDNQKIILNEHIPANHKISLFDFRSGDNVIKYGAIIGHTKVDISAGSWIHDHNIETNLTGKESYRFIPQNIELGGIRSSHQFLGYKRRNRRVGIRNDIWIIPLVGCVNTLATQLAKKFNELTGNVDINGCYAFTHPFGCSQLGDDHRRTQQILAGIAHNPNAAGVLFIGLGCENNTLDSFLKIYNPIDQDRFEIMIAQEVEDEIESGLNKLQKLYDTVRYSKREVCDLSHLSIGLKCGSSDSLSGVTANPLVGTICDRIVANGGSCLMTEVPEMFGAERILLSRSKNHATFTKGVEMINAFKDYYQSYNHPIYENPSPGNKKGGITTLEEKSLGCIQKGGTAPVVDILHYGGQVSKPGLSLVYGPGNDPISVTNLTASGAQMILFTTGSGNPFGSPVPTLKISSNSKIAEIKKNWIDFDAGMLLTGRTIEDLSDELMEIIIRVANGELLTNSEINNYREIAIFKDGVTV